jgi:hypothetical protein
MRTGIRTIAAVALCTLAAATPAPASASGVSTVRPRLLGADVGWVARADATTVAYGARERGAGAMTVDDGGAVRAVPSPAGCFALTAGSGHLFYDCGEEFDWSTEIDHRHGRVTDLDGAEQARLDYDVRSIGADGAAPSDAAAIGEQWFRLYATCHHCDTWSIDYNWHTGQVREVGLHDPALFEDLDAPLLTVPLCRPLRQNPAPPHDFENWPVMLPVEVHRPWALVGVATETPTGYQEASTLRRCGSSRPVAMPAGTSPFALGDGWVALWRKKPRSGSRLELLRLRDRRRFAVAGRWGRQPPQVVLTARRAVIRGDAVSFLSAYTLRLPRR